jgi:hypothetical protein
MTQYSRIIDQFIFSNMYSAIKKFKQLSLLYKIWDFHRDEYSYCGPFGHDTV